MMQDKKVGDAQCLLQNMSCNTLCAHSLDLPTSLGRIAEQDVSTLSPIGNRIM